MDFDRYRCVLDRIFPFSKLPEYRHRFRFQKYCIAFVSDKKCENKNSGVFRRLFTTVFLGSSPTQTIPSTGLDSVSASAAAPSPTLTRCRKASTQSPYRTRPHDRIADVRLRRPGPETRRRSKTNDPRKGASPNGSHLAGLASGSDLLRSPAGSGCGSHPTDPDPPPLAADRRRRG